MRRLAQKGHSVALFQLVSRVSAVMKFGLGDVEDPFVKVKDMITDLMNKLQSEASSEAVAGDELFAKVKELTRDSIVRFESDASSEAGHMPYRDDELTHPTEKKADLESQVATDSFDIQRLRQ